MELGCCVIQMDGGVQTCPKMVMVSKHHAYRNFVNLSIPSFSPFIFPDLTSRVVCAMFLVVKRILHIAIRTEWPLGGLPNTSPMGMLRYQPDQPGYQVHNTGT